MIRSLYTSLLYLAVFIPSLFFTSVAEKYAGKKQIRFLIFSCLSIMIPTLFAGFRGEEVGTDILVYAVPEFQKCISAGSWSAYLKISSSEKGYAFIVIISALIGKSVNCLLILTEFLQILPIYIVAYRLRDRVSMNRVLLAFFCLNYVIGFNVMRQSIAASFILLFYVEVIYKKYKNSIFCAVVAFLFHNTAVIGFVFAIIGFAVYAIKRQWLRSLIIFWGTVIAILLMTQWQNIAYMAMYMGLLPAEKLKVYIDVFTGVNIGTKGYMFEVAYSQYIEVLLKGVYLIVPTLCIIKKTGRHKFDIESLKKDRFIYSVIFVGLIGVLIDFLVLILFHSAYGYRMALYAEYFFIILIPLACGRHKIIVSKPMTGMSFKITYNEALNYGMLFFSFYILFMYFGQHETLPFYFQIY